MQIENLYDVQNIIEGYNVHVRSIQLEALLDIELERLQPAQVIMLEPYLGCMRIMEAYEA